MGRDDEYQPYCRICGQDKSTHDDGECRHARGLDPNTMQ